jgi:Gram-negative bacterial TonB protein C-terminal
MQSCQGHLVSFPRRSVFSIVCVCVFAFSLSGAAQAPPKPEPHKHSVARLAPEPPAKPVSEDELRAQFQGKTVYLRGGYLDNELRFDEQGRLVGTSPQVPYTLSMFEVSKVHVSKRRVQFEGIRLALHFLGAGAGAEGAGEDSLTASDKVRITPKKKTVRITIERAEAVKPAKEKKSKDGPVPQSAAPAASEQWVMTQARANKLLTNALDRVFSFGLDEKMIAAMPDYWQSYYKEVANKSDYKPADPSVMRQANVDQKARLLSVVEPASNDFAQQAGVAGIALYHVVVGSDGKASTIAIGRPIGFGLDENAVTSIRKASFAPAIKGGKPVPVLLDLLVQFRIYSKRTGAPDPPDAGHATLSEPQAPSLPGPYSTTQPASRQP